MPSLPPEFWISGGSYILALSLATVATLSQTLTQSRWILVFLLPDATRQPGKDVQDEDQHLH